MKKGTQKSRFKFLSNKEVETIKAHFDAVTGLIEGANIIISTNPGEGARLATNGEIINGVYADSEESMYVRFSYKLKSEMPFIEHYGTKLTGTDEAGKNIYERFPVAHEKYGPICMNVIKEAFKNEKVVGKYKETVYAVRCLQSAVKSGKFVPSKSAAEQEPQEPQDPTIELQEPQAEGFQEPVMEEPQEPQTESNMEPQEPTVDSVEESVELPVIDMVGMNAMQLAHTIRKLLKLEGHYHAQMKMALGYAYKLMRDEVSQSELFGATAAAEALHQSYQEPQQEPVVETPKAPKKFYAVFLGRATGVFTDWATCEEQVKGYPGAIYKSFKTEEEANDYLAEEARIAEAARKEEQARLAAEEARKAEERRQAAQAAKEARRLAEEQARLAEEQARLAEEARLQELAKQIAEEAKSTASGYSINPLDDMEEEAPRFVLGSFAPIKKGERKKMAQFFWKTGDVYRPSGKFPAFSAIDLDRTYAKVALHKIIEKAPVGAVIEVYGEACSLAVKSRPELIQMIEDKRLVIVKGEIPAEDVAAPSGVSA